MLSHQHIAPATRKMIMAGEARLLEILGTRGLQMKLGFQSTLLLATLWQEIELLGNCLEGVSSDWRHASRLASTQMSIRIQDIYELKSGSFQVQSLSDHVLRCMSLRESASHTKDRPFWHFLKELASFSGEASIYLRVAEQRCFHTKSFAFCGKVSAASFQPEVQKPNPPMQKLNLRNSRH